jgi:oligoendopeptidase F
MKTTWNLKLLYNSPNDPNIEKDIKKSKRLVSAFCRKWEDDSRYTKNSKVLKEALDDYEKLILSNPFCDKPLYYLALKNSLNQTDIDVKAKMNKVGDIATKLYNEIQFFELNISKIPIEKQKKLLTSPVLKEYKHFLERIFLLSKYLLTEKEEKIFTLTSKTSHSNWVSMMDELLDKQLLKVNHGGKKKITIPYNEVNKYLDSKEKKVRDYVVKKYNEVNNRYLEIAEFEINSVLESKKISDEYRGIPRPDLTRHISDDIDSKVVDTLVEAVSNNFNIPRDFYKLKAKLLNQKKLGYYERNVPLGDVDMEYTFNDGMKLVKDTLYDLDSEFGAIFNRFVNEGQVDVFPKTNKSGGAYCTSPEKTLPTFILLNHTDRLNDVLTIAHESGHGIHSEMSKVQNSLNCNYPISLAEVASIFFEDFVLEEILKNSDEETKFSILTQKLNSDISSVFRQVAFYNFETELHTEFKKRGYLSKEYISDMFCKHMRSYMGDTVLQDDSMKTGWIYVGHFRRFFYVYSYASGLLISKALQSMVREDKKNISLVKKLLSSGSTQSPKDLFKGMGIDIMDKDFWNRGIIEIEKSLKEIKLKN